MFLQRCQQKKINPLDFIFQRARTKKCRVQIPAIFWGEGGVDKKWNVPIGAPEENKDLIINKLVKLDEFYKNLTFYVFLWLC